MSGFHHEAVFYGSDEEYVSSLLPELHAALGADGAVLVAIGEDKVRLLCGALGADADRVEFTDMERLGQNPARIIPAWREFMAGEAAGPRLGIGEPAWPGRSEPELIECRRHESMLNLAFEGGDPWRLLCPYDMNALSPEVLADARHNHPHVSVAGVSRRSAHYLAPPTMLARDRTLPDPASEPAELEFTRDDLALVRTFAGELAVEAGLEDPRLADLVLAVNELAANSMRHAGGRGRVRLWREEAELLCEVADDGHIADPLTGRQRQPDAHGGGRGLWLVNHLCDLVELRSSQTGTVVRLHMSVSPAT